MKMRNKSVKKNQKIKLTISTIIGIILLIVLSITITNMIKKMDKESKMKMTVTDYCNSVNRSIEPIIIGSVNLVGEGKKLSDNMVANEEVVNIESIIEIINESIEFLDTLKQPEQYNNDKSSIILHLTSLKQKLEIYKQNVLDYSFEDMKDILEQLDASIAELTTDWSNYKG